LFGLLVLGQVRLVVRERRDDVLEMLALGRLLILAVLKIGLERRGDVNRTLELTLGFLEELDVVEEVGDGLLRQQEVHRRARVGLLDGPQELADHLALSHDLARLVLNLSLEVGDLEIRGVNLVLVGLDVDLGLGNLVPQERQLVVERSRRLAFRVNLLLVGVHLRLHL
jgi:hypothetical protein